VSHTTRRDLVAAFPDAADKTAVVHNGVEPEEPGTAGPAPHDGRPFVLYVGTFEPRKNVLRLVAAMESIWDRRADFPDLVLAAGTGGNERLRGRRRELSPRVAPHARGLPRPGERARWLKEARVFAYPSLYEGFGLPPSRRWRRARPSWARRRRRFRR